MSLFKKPANMRWVDLAIWIDNNFYNEDCDHNKAYEYMYLLASMLASKHRYFDNKKDYEEFAAILAYDTFKRMSNTDKSRIKSVLNYMKSIMSFRKMSFNCSKRQKIIDPKFDLEWDSAAYIDKCKNAYEASNSSDVLFESIVDLFKTVPSCIRKNIPKIYKCDKVQYENIYMSCLLSMLNRVTLPEKYDDKIQVKLDNKISFDEIAYYKKHLDDDIILWHLEDGLEKIVAMVLNKVYCNLIDDINSFTNDTKVTDNEFNNIMLSGWPSGSGKDDSE